MSNKELQNAIDILTASLKDDEKLYPSQYVANKVLLAQSRNPGDVVLGTMKDTILKIASKQEFISQHEVDSIFNDFVGLNKQSSARYELSDILSPLPEIKTASRTSNLRTNEEINLTPIRKDSELSDALSIIFGLNKSSDNASTAKRTVIASTVSDDLSLIGLKPTSVDIVNENEHFALAVASYNTSSFKRASVKIPVRISDGRVHSPDCIIDGSDTVPFNKKNVLVALKMSEEMSKRAAFNKLSNDRFDAEPIKQEKVQLPSALDFADIESALVAASSKYSSEQIKLASSIVSSELIDLGIKSSNIKVASSTPNTIVFDASIYLSSGPAKIQVPVEFTNGKPLLPSKFASDVNSMQKIYSLDSNGINAFASVHAKDSTLSSVARVNDLYSNMTYAQLMDSVFESVSSQNLNSAEDALSVIQKKFSAEQFKSALDDFANILKHASTESSERSELIKSAVARGELIRIPTTVELYSPKLGLPISKIAFDESGKMVPLRSAKNKLSSGTQINTSNIVIN